MAPTSSYSGGRFVDEVLNWHWVGVGAEGTSRISGGALARFGRRSRAGRAWTAGGLRRARARGRPALVRAAPGVFTPVECGNDVRHGGYRIATGHENAGG